MFLKIVIASISVEQTTTRVKSMFERFKDSRTTVIKHIFTYLFAKRNIFAENSSLAVAIDFTLHSSRIGSIANYRLHRSVIETRYIQGVRKVVS